MTPRTLSIWIAVLVSVSLFRVFSTIRWHQVKRSLTSANQTLMWHRLIQVMVFICSVAWGYAGWIGAQSTSLTQQIVTSVSVLFLSAGALVCWAPSLGTMLIAVMPIMLPWAVSYTLSDDPSFQFVGVIGIISVLITTRAAFTLYRYIDQSLKLNVENSELAKDLQQEILIKDRAEEALRLALSSSDAIEWRWNIENDLFTCKGDLRRSLGLNTTYFAGNLDEVARLYPDDQEKFRAKLLLLALKGGEIYTDLRINWPNGLLRDLALRGKAQQDSSGAIKHITGIAWDTTSQKSQAKLQQDKDAYEAANKAKSFFLANASHEIRTPLAAINGFVESLLQNDNSKKNIRSDLEAISRNTKFLSSLVNDFLDLSEIESGRFYIQKSSLSPRQEIEDCLSLVKTSLEIKGLKLEVIYETPIPDRIESDPVRFRQILVNLLSNAVKFTEKGQVTLRVSHNTKLGHPSHLVLRLKDTGIGIDDRTRTQLFQPFIRGQTLEVQKVYGSGLGLALSKNLAQILGGDLKLNYSSPETGTEFEFYIQASSPQSISSQLSPDSERKNRLNQLKILVVDDAADLRVLMRRYLERLGALVETCENGLEAVQKTEFKTFDVILMDIKMPIMDGHEATERLRQRGYKNPIIAITAHASADDKKRSLQSGCNAYLSKPVNFSSLTETILNFRKAAAVAEISH